MKIFQTSSFNSAPKTTNINTPKHATKANCGNSGDTFTFGMNSKNIKPILTETNKITSETQNLINKVIKLIEVKGAKQTRQLENNEIAIAEKLPDGNFKITFTTSGVDDVIITTKDGLFDIESIGRDEKAKSIKYEGLASKIFDCGLAKTLKENFLNEVI